MQIEVLKFLIESHSYLRAERNAENTEMPHADLQAVERLLPDCDWFETGDEVVAARRLSSELWLDRTGRLEFN